MKASAASYAEDGKAKGADRLSDVAETVDRVADQVADQSPAMADWVRKAADELESASRNLKTKSVGDLLTMGRDFARREPAAFIAASALAGFALSRLLKSSSSASSHTASSSAALHPLGSGSGGAGTAHGPGATSGSIADAPRGPESATRSAPSPSVQAADTGFRAGTVTQFPLDAESPKASGDGDHAK